MTEPAAYDEVAESYRGSFDPDGTGLRDEVLEELLGDVAGQQVLALACGQGRDAPPLADLGAAVTGVDYSERMLEQARRYEQESPRGIAFVQGDAQTLAGLADDRFDGVVCHMALMDIPRLAPTVESVARVLRPRGWFV